MANTINPCFNDFIGIKNDPQSTTTPTSKLFINDLEGINTTFAADIADEDYQSGIELLREKINFSIGLVTDELQMYLLPHFRFNSIMENRNLGDFDDGYNAVAALERGLRIERTKNKFGEIYINSLVLKIDTNKAGVNINIWTTTPSLGGVPDDVITVDLLADVDNEVRIDKGYAAHYVWITTDQTGPEEYGDGTVSRGCNCRSKDYGYLSVSGWTGVKTDGKLYGITANVNLNCDANALLCMLKSKLGYIILYRAGIEIVKEAKASDRLSYFTLNDEERSERLEESFYDEYRTRIKTFVSQLPLLLNKIDDICLNCNHTRYSYSYGNGPGGTRYINRVGENV